MTISKLYSPVQPSFDRLRMNGFSVRGEPFGRLRTGLSNHVLG